MLRRLPIIFAVLVLLLWPAWAQTNKHDVVLTWNETSTNATGYNVYRGTVSGGPYTKLNPTPITAQTFADTTGTTGTKYFYVTTALDSSGSESAFSNEASGTFLGPPAPPSGLAAVSN